MAPGLGPPGEAPAAPGPGVLRGLELGLRPRGAAVGADLDPLDRPPAGPGPAFEHVLAGLHRALAGMEVRDSGRDDQRARQHPVERLAVLVLGLAKVVRPGLLVAVEGAVEHLDR